MHQYVTIRPKPDRTDLRRSNRGDGGSGCKYNDLRGFMIGGGGLKTRRVHSHGGSIPPPGTNLRPANPISYAVLFPSFYFAPFLPLEG